MSAENGQPVELHDFVELFMAGRPRAAERFVKLAQQRMDDRTDFDDEAYLGILGEELDLVDSLMRHWSRYALTELATMPAARRFIGRWVLDALMVVNGVLWALDCGESPVAITGSDEWLNAVAWTRRRARRLAEQTTAMNAPTLASDPNLEADQAAAEHAARYTPSGRPREVQPDNVVPARTSAIEAVLRDGEARS